MSRKMTSAVIGFLQAGISFWETLYASGIWWLFFGFTISMSKNLPAPLQEIRLAGSERADTGC